MTEVQESSFFLNHRELAKLLMTAKGIHDGVWMLQVNFNMLGLNAGPSPEEMSPSVIVGITGVGLAKVNEIAPLCFDAAELNPLPGTATATQESQASPVHKPKKTAAKKVSVKKT